MACQMVMPFLRNRYVFSYCKVFLCIILKQILYLLCIAVEKYGYCNAGKCVYFGKDRCY